MKFSLQKKFTFFMIVWILFISVILIVSNNFLTEKYYLSEKKKELIDTSNEIQKIFDDPTHRDENGNFILDESVSKELSMIEQRKSQNVSIDMKDNFIFYPGKIDIAIKEEENPSLPNLFQQDFFSFSFNINEEDQGNIIPKNSNVGIIEINNYTKEELLEKFEDGSAFYISTNEYINTKSLSFKRPSYKDNYINVFIPLEEISVGVKISNKVISQIGSILILLTIVWSIIISKKITTPILNINRITKKMKGLDFSETITLKSKDELSELSESINSLSDTLDEKIKELNLKNKNLEENFDKEQKINKMRKYFFSAASHELKTPIFLIQGYAEGLKNNLKLEERRNFYCDVILEETSKMDKLVKNFLLISKLESEDEKLNLEFININDFLENIIAKYVVLFKEKEIKFDFLCNENDFVLIDKLKIEQVITNFLNNAIEHVDNDKNIRIQVEKENGELNISVFNSGKNIPEDFTNKIWDSFYKLDNARSRDIGGAGIGLSIVRLILETHNFNFGVFNEKNGVSFWFKIPVRNNNEIKDFIN